MSECYSCGKDADAKSPRNFCVDCDAEFEDGLDHQQDVIDRAERLETAKLEGDSETVGTIMAEIFEESVTEPQEASTPVSSATVTKGDE